MSAGKEISMSIVTAPSGEYVTYTELSKKFGVDRRTVSLRVERAQLQTRRSPLDFRLKLVKFTEAAPLFESRLINIPEAR